MTRPRVTPLPEVGDLVLLCEHADLRECCRFWYMEHATYFIRPDGTSAEAHYLACCESCFQAARGRPERATFCADVAWSADFTPVRFDGPWMPPLVVS